MCGESEKVSALYQRKGYTILRCSVCSLTYVSDVPSRGELDRIYSREFFDVGEKFGGDRAGPSYLNAQKRLQELFKLPGISRGKWLDVGCGTGEFMLAAKPFVQQIKGVEISDYAVREAESRGLRDLIVGDFLETDLKAEKFDLISMWDVIEHVCDPKINLEKAFDLLKPGGYLVITTGNIDSWTAKLMGRFWHLMIPPRHLYFFSYTTLSRMLRDVGFASISLRFSGKRVPLDFMIWKLTYVFLPRLSPLSLRASKMLRLGKIAPVVNLRDIMTVVAIKR